MPKTTTSLRLEDDLRWKLSEIAGDEGITVSALIERLVREGLAMLAHPGITFNPGPSGRRATVRNGPDVWEIMSTWRYLDGTVAERTATLIEEYKLNEWQVNSALDYTAAHRDEIDDRIAANDRIYEDYERRADERERLIP